MTSTTRPDRDECARAARLLARLDAAADEHRDDPAASLSEADSEWLARHLDACASCARADHEAVAPLLDVLRALDRADVPDDLFLAARRREILSAIGVEPSEPAPRRAWPSHAARQAQRRRRTVWAAVGALAASIALLLAVPRWRDQGVEVARPPVGVPPPATEATSLVASLDPAELATADDAWLVASSNFLGLELDDPRERDRELNQLTDEELDEIEGVFVSVQGWS